MASREFELEIGKSTAKFSIPAEHLLYERVGENIAPPEDLEEAYRHTLSYPIDEPVDLLSFGPIFSYASESSLT